MKPTPKKSNKKIFFLGIAGIFLLLLVSAPLAHAQSTGNQAAPLANPAAGAGAPATPTTGGVLNSIQTGASNLVNKAVNSVIPAIGSAFIGNIVYILALIIASVLGILVAIEAWLIGVILAINATIFQSTMVQSGFSISLAVANMAFVLGIIVIAIATILRRESYGIKQLLWKLVVMAILVNFGLVIASPIFAIGNSFSQYFVNCINPTAGGCSGTGSGYASYAAFATTFAGAFNPQNSFTALSNSQTSLSNSTGNTQFSIGSGAFAISASVVQQIVPIFGILFLVINIVLIVIVLGALNLMLLIRYLYITILAILLPLAWASWAFPAFSHHFESWWKKFLQWTFFLPVSLFFIYLALKSMALGGDNATLITTYASMTAAPTTPWGAIVGFLSGVVGGAVATILQAFLQEIILAGLIIGGLIAADSMSIKFAGTAVDALSAGATYLAAEHGARGAKRTWHAIGGHGVTNKLATSNNRYVARFGRMLSSTQTTAGDVAKEKKKLEGMSKGTFMAQKDGAMNDHEMLAWANHAIENKWGDADTTINGRRIADIIDDKALIERNGQGKLAKDFDKADMSNIDFRNAQRAAAGTMVRVSDPKGINYIDPATGTSRMFAAGTLVDRDTLMDAAAQKVMKESETEDLAKGDVNALFKEFAVGTPQYEAQQVRLKNLRYAPQAPAKLIPKMSSSTLKNFNEAMNGPRGILTIGRMPITRQEADIEDNARTLEIHTRDLETKNRDLETSKQVLDAATKDQEKIAQQIKEATEEADQKIRAVNQEAEQAVRDASQRVGSYRNVGPTKADVDAVIQGLRARQLASITNLNTAKTVAVNNLNNQHANATTAVNNATTAVATVTTTISAAQSNGKALEADLERLKENSEWEKLYVTTNRVLIGNLEKIP